MQGTPSQLVAFTHAALFSPSHSTLRQALQQNFLVTIPSLTPKLLSKYPPNSIATAKGHFDQTRKNIQSTKPKPSLPFPSSLTATSITLPTDNDDDNTFPSSATLGLPSNHCLAAVMETTGQVFTNQTGRFILPSSQGYTQLLILYCYNANYIHAKPMKSKTAATIFKANQAGYTTLVSAGLKPRLQQLDASVALKSFLHESDSDFQSAPPPASIAAILPNKPSAPSKTIS
jgi:hypothetical protein